MSNWIRTLSFLCVTLLTIGLQACSPVPEEAKSQLEQIQSRGTLRVGTVFGAITYSENEQGPSGLEYDLAKQFADYLNVKLEIIPTHHLNELLRQLHYNEIDLIASAMTVTDSRAKQVRFAPIYYQVSQKLVFKKGTPWPRNISQLNGSLEVITGSSHAEKLAQLKTTHPELQWQESDTDNSESLLLKVHRGEIDYTIVDSPLLDAMRRYYPELFIGFTVSELDGVAWGLPQSDDDSLYALTIEFFSQLRANNTITELEHKYFSHINQFDYVDTRSFIRAAKYRLPKYKALFEKHAGTINWELLAAISYQESHWNPKATSYTGVRGLMMLTQATANIMKVKNRLDPEQSINGGARYLERILQRIPDKVPESEKIWFALAAYNVGFGHVIDAMEITQLRGGNKFSWVDVQENLPLLRQRQWYQKTQFGYARGEEPVRYVTNIRRYYETLQWLERNKMREQALKQQTVRFSNITEIMQDIGEDGEMTSNEQKTEGKNQPTPANQKAE